MPIPVPPYMLARRFGPLGSRRVADLALDLGRPRCRPRTRATRPPSPSGRPGTPRRRPVQSQLEAARGGRPRASLRYMSAASIASVGVEQRLAGVVGAEAPDVVAVVEVVAAVGPQHVGEVVHQRVVLLGLVARAVRDRPSGLFSLSHFGRLVVLLPRRVVVRASGRSRGPAASGRGWLLEEVLAVHPDHRRRVVGQRVELAPCRRTCPAASSWVGMKSSRSSDLRAGPGPSLNSC